MITPLDNDYKDAKLIKQGKKRLETPFKELAEWINREYDVNVLNIYYDFIQNGKRPRLNVILEFLCDKNKFNISTETFYGYDGEKQAAISVKFNELLESESSKNRGFLKRLLSNKPNYKYDTNDILVTFGIFETVAKNEANSNIPEEKIQELKESINDNELWEISRCFANTTFFFYTDVQLNQNKNNGKKEKLTELYYNLIKFYDEFDYIKKEDFLIFMDSKENFDNNYQGSWFYYYR